MKKEYFQMMVGCFFALASCALALDSSGETALRFDWVPKLKNGVISIAILNEGKAPVNSQKYANIDVQTAPVTSDSGAASVPSDSTVHFKIVIIKRADANHGGAPVAMFGEGKRPLPVAVSPGEKSIVELPINASYVDDLKVASEIDCYAIYNGQVLSSQKLKKGDGIGDWSLQ